MADGSGGDPSRLRRVSETFTEPVAGVWRRLQNTRLMTWIVFEGERSLVVLALLAVVFAVFLGLAVIRPVDMEQLLSETSTLSTLFTSLLSGAILIVSVVSSISSIVLSQEITDIETEQERIDASIEFRRRTENMADVEGSPGQPAAFLEVILHTIYRETKELAAIAAESDDREFADQAQSFAEEVLEEARDAATTLEGAKFGTFRVLSAGLHYDYSWQLNTARRLQNRYGDSLSDAEAEALSDLIDTLKFFATGREYFQSLYYKREVARLSSMLLYVSLPVIVFISYLLLALDANVIPNARVGATSTLSIFILFAYTVSLAPYVVLTAHVIRVAGITMQTLAAGPFTTGQRDHSEIVEVEMDTDPEQWDDEIDLGPAGSDADEGEAAGSRDATAVIDDALDRESVDERTTGDADDSADGDARRAEQRSD